MKIVLGSINRFKIEAVKEVIEENNLFSNYNFKFQRETTQVPKNPVGLDNIMRNARLKALDSFQYSKNCTFGVGIAFGLIKTSKVRSGYLYMPVCTVFNGKDYAVTTGISFELNQEVAQKLDQSKDLLITDAIMECAICKDRHEIASKGIVYIVSGGKFTLKDTVKPALILAFSQMTCPDEIDTEEDNEAALAQLKSELDLSFAGNSYKKIEQEDHNGFESDDGFKDEEE